MTDTGSAVATALWTVVVAAALAVAVMAALAVRVARAAQSGGVRAQALRLVGGALRLVDAQLPPFRPTPWMPAWMHTIWGNVARPRPRGLVSVLADHIRLPDGGAIAVDWLGEPAAAASAARGVLLIVPGTRGTWRAPYVLQMAAEGLDRGFIPCVAALRGCGMAELATPQCFDGAAYTDIAAVVADLRSRIPPTTPIVAVGYSMGGSMLLHYLAETG
jgi:uncharacterized protein